MFEDKKRAIVSSNAALFNFKIYPTDTIITKNTLLRLSNKRYNSNRYTNKNERISL